MSSDNDITPQPSELTVSLRSALLEAKSGSDGQETASNRELGLLYEQLSDSLHADGLLEECMINLQWAIDIYIGYQDNKALARLYNKAGCTVFQMRKYKEATGHFEKQTSHALENKKVVFASQGITNQAVVALLTADQASAIKLIEKSMAVLEGIEEGEVRGEQHTGREIHHMAF